MYTSLAGWCSPRYEYHVHTYVGTYVHLLINTRLSFEDKLVLGSTISITMDTISAIDNIKSIDNIKTIWVLICRKKSIVQISILIKSVTSNTYVCQFNALSASLDKRMISHYTNLYIRYIVIFAKDNMYATNVNIAQLEPTHLAWYRHGRLVLNYRHAQDLQEDEPRQCACTHVHTHAHTHACTNAHTHSMHTAHTCVCSFFRISFLAKMTPSALPVTMMERLWSLASQISM